MTPWLILLIIVIIVFIVWWALMRNAKMYKPEFKVHGHEEEQHTHPNNDYGSAAGRTARNA